FPALLGGAAGDVPAQLLDPGGYLIGRRIYHRWLKDLLLQERTVNELVERRQRILLVHGAKRFPKEQGLHALRLIQLAFQDHVLVYHRHHAVNHCLGAARSGDPQQQCELEGDSHQNVWPMLKKKLKCFNTWDEGTAGAGGLVMGKAGGFRLYPKSRLTGPMGVRYRMPAPTATDM